MSLRAGRLRLGIWRVSHRRKGCSASAKRTCDSGAWRASRVRGSKSPGTLRQTSRSISRMRSARSRTPVLPASCSIAARSTGSRRSSFSAASMSSRCRRSMSSRRDCSCSKPWRAACRSCSRGMARFPRCSREPLAGFSSIQAIRRASQKVSTRCGSLRRSAPSSDSEDSTACESTTAFAALPTACSRCMRAAEPRCDGKECWSGARDRD